MARGQNGETVSGFRSKSRRRVNGWRFAVGRLRLAVGAPLDHATCQLLTANRKLPTVNR
jgi:hypothetical protein